MMCNPLSRIGEKETTLLVVESALHLGRRTNFRGLQGIQLIDLQGMCYRRDYRKVSGIPSGSNYHFTTSYAVQRGIPNLTAYHAHLLPSAQNTSLPPQPPSHMTVGSQSSLSSVISSRQLYMKKHNTNTHSSPVDFVTSECQLAKKKSFTSFCQMEPVTSTYSY